MLDKKIEYFIVVVQEGSFSAAARKLYLSQANLSRQIAQLENELGVKLFYRDGYRPELTETGNMFYRECRMLQRDAERILEKLGEAQKKSIRVGFTGAFENREILDAIKSFQTQNEDIEVSLSRRDFEGCVNGLLTDQLDISFGLESTFRRYKEIQYDILHGYDICLICAHNHPFAKMDSVEIDRIQNQDMIILSRNFSRDFYRDFMDACKQDGYLPNIKKEVDTFDELVFSVSIGEGVAIVGKNVVRENEVKAVHIEGTHHSSNFVIAYMEQKRESEFQQFVDHVKRYFETL
jgi:DNA-binding transcriptional LysR family regulator